MPTVLAVDGNSLGHRAFHATRDDARPGVPWVTGAVLRMIGGVWRHGPYDAVVVGFDHPHNQRKVDHPEYKAQRPPTPPELTASLVALRGHLVEFGFHVAEIEGAEADDLLAAAADGAVARGWRCDLLSSDRDLTALVNADVRLLRPRASMVDLLLEDEAAVRARYGIEPHQYVDLAALRGDPSDGLRGAHGIGPKMAARLLRDHGSVLALYDVLHDLPPKVEAALRGSRAEVERNLVLMAPLPHLEVDVAAAVAAGIDLDRVDATCQELGLGAAAGRFRANVTAPPPPPTPPPPDDPDEAGTPVVRREPVALAAGEQVSLF